MNVLHFTKITATGLEQNIASHANQRHLLSSAPSSFDTNMLRKKGNGKLIRCHHSRQHVSDEVNIKDQGLIYLLPGRERM